MVDLRWLVKDGTTTEPPVLQFRDTSDDSVHYLWTTVPRVTEAQVKAEEE